MDMVPFVSEDVDIHFPAPTPLQYEDYFKYIDEHLPPENPLVMGLHPNTEIAMRTDETTMTFKSILSLQSGAKGGGGSGQNMTQRVSAMLDDILEKVDEVMFDLPEIL